MKKLIHIIISILLLVSGIQAVSLAESNSTLTQEYNVVLNDVHFTETTDYTTINFAEDHTFLREIGKPMIPRITKTFILPFTSQINDITITFHDRTYQRLTKPLPATPAPQPLDHQQNSLHTNSQIYRSTSFYPTQNYQYQLGAGIYENEQVTFLTVHCYPIQYLPATNMVSIAHETTITISYTPPKDPPQPQSNENDLHIIAPAEFTEALQPLLEHKNSYGVSTALTTLDDILGQYPGRDDPEQIKYFIKDLIETQGTSYLLLVGSVNKLPMRYSAVRIWGETSMPTDLYYADIYEYNGDFADWDSNHNDIFGEFDWDNGPIDQVDLYADIGVGRLPCDTTAEVTTMVDKIITYETKTAGSPWFNRFIVMGGDTFPNHGNIEGEFVTQKILDERPEFTPKKIWTSLHNFNPLSINLAITQGAGFISYSGHGYEQGFGTSPPNIAKRKEYWSPYLLGLFNIDKYPIVFFDACSTTKLDFNMEDFEAYIPIFSVVLKTLAGDNYDPSKLVPVFAWQMLKKPVGGAIATVGATRVAFTHVDAGGIHAGAGYLNLHFHQAYTPGIAVVDMLISAQNDYLNNVGKDCVTLEEFILLGDPSLKTGGY